MRQLIFIFSIFTMITALPLHAQQASQAVPEAFTGLNYKKATYSANGMVSAANPHAVNAGVKMIEQGGNAIDAVVAIQLVLTLVEPQSSGIGGGAFMLWYDNVKKELTTFDGRETAPESATPELFVGQNGKAIPWIKALVGGRSVGTPGVLEMLWQVHQQYGKLPWKKLFQPAIKLAQDGFIVSPRLATLVQIKFNPGLTQLKAARNYFYPNGKVIEAGQLLKNPEYAATLIRISEKGISDFYQGQTAKGIVEAVKNSEIAPGKLTLGDLKNYKSKRRDAVCMDYRGETGDYEVCSMGPPSSGGLTVLQILKLLEPYQLNKHTVDSLETVHLYTQAAKLAYADRDKYLADSDFVSVPNTQHYLDKDYLDSRRQLISLKADMGHAKAGDISINDFAPNEDISQPNTSHISIIDKKGNALSMTTTIEMGFGSAVMAEGFLLNNQLTDFSLSPKRNGKLVANRVAANKRPRSSLTPVIIFKGDKGYAVIGSPGGSQIINYVGYALIGLLDFGMDMKQVVDMPRISNRNGATSLEKGTKVAKLFTQLEKMGHKVKVVNLNSGIQGVLKTDKGWQGAADPRREGTAIGL